MRGPFAGRARGNPGLAMTSSPGGRSMRLEGILGLQVLLQPGEDDCEEFFVKRMRRGGTAAAQEF